jgi:hypothetical protein
MNQPIGITRRELIDMMMQNGIHTSVDKFEALAVEIQKKVIEAAGVPVKIEVIQEEK